MRPRRLTERPLPERTRARPERESASYFQVLRTGLATVLVRPTVRGAVLAVALLGGLDAFEEYLPLVAQGWGVPTGLVPLALLGVPLAGAAGAALGGAAEHLRPRTLALVLLVGVFALAVADVTGHPAGLAGVAVFYGLYRMALVVADARLQHRIEGPARATVTSVAAVGMELAALLVYAAWALGEVAFVAGLTVAVAATLSRCIPDASARG